MFATKRAMALDSKMQPCDVSSTGTLPMGDLLRNSGVKLSVPILKSGMSSSTPLYSAAIRILKARKLP